GVLIGVALAVSVSRFVERMLFHVPVLNGSVYALVTAGVVSAVLLAGALPAMRASKADPVTSLRHE
ncbi:MAG: hypothetical protein ABI837_16760, partial [Acidobacteriota bacterium]